MEDGSRVQLDLCLETTSPRGRHRSHCAHAAAAADGHHRPEPEAFSCNYCHRKFFSSQALGGHQNAHKLERTLAKRSRDVSAAPASPSPPPVHWRLDGDGGHFWAYRAAARAAGESPSSVVAWSTGAWTTAGAGRNGEPAAEIDTSLKL